MHDGSVALGKLLGFPEPRGLIPAGLFLLFEAYDRDIDVFGEAGLSEARIPPGSVESALRGDA